MTTPLTDAERHTLDATIASKQARIEELVAEINRLRWAGCALSALEADKRISAQKHDCTYGDTPGLIHCSIHNPCTTHQLELSRVENKALREALDGFQNSAYILRLREELDRLRSLISGGTIWTGGEK